MNIVTKITVGLGVIALVIAGTMAASIVETNTAGYLQVKQAALTGNMSVRTEPGMYLQNFGDIFEYKISDTYTFKNEPIKVRFNDAATANITGQIKFKLPQVESSMLAIHKDYRSYSAVEHDLIRQVVAASLKQSATHFGAEEIYSTRRSDFIQLVSDQIKDGLYATSYDEETTIDSDGNERTIRHVNTKVDKDGNAIINEVSAFKKYDISVIQFVIHEVDFDEQTDGLIAQRKQAEQKEIVAKAEAKKAKQDAIREEEMGKAAVAKAKYAALVIKESAVIQAEKLKEVAIQGALRAEEEKKAIIAKGEAEAQAAKLKVAAGLSPVEKATFERDTAIGVAQALATVKLPGVMVIGGGEGSNNLNPFDAVGLESFMRIAKKAAEDR